MTQVSSSIPEVEEAVNEWMTGVYDRRIDELKSIWGEEGEDDVEEEEEEDDSYDDGEEESNEWVSEELSTNDNTPF